MVYSLCFSRSTGAIVLQVLVDCLDNTIILPGHRYSCNFCFISWFYLAEKLIIPL